MAYGVKYRVQYKRRSGTTTFIHILEEDYVGTITDLDPNVNPFEISYTTDVNNIYTPTVGAGAVIRVYVQPLTMLDLFTDDDQKYKVIAYNGSTGDTANIFFQGFVNTDIYFEDYSSSMDVPIEIQCNDGMQVLDNIPYLDTSIYSSGAYYKDTTYYYIIFQNILNKIGLTFDNIYTSNDLRIADFATNFLFYLAVPHENFVDESGSPWSCRKVLNSLVGALGMVMKFRGNKIYIVDPINLHTPSKGKRYDLVPVIGYGATDVNVGGYLDISGTTLGWYQTGQKLDIVPAKNVIKVNYDPYNYQGYVYEFGDSNNWPVTGSFESKGDYYINTGVTFNGWSNIGGTYNGYGIKEDVYDLPEYGLYFNDSNASFFYTFPFSNITQDSNLSIKVKMDVFVNTHTTDNIFSEETETTKTYVKIPIDIKVGNKYYNGSNSWGTTLTTQQYLYVVEPPYTYYYKLSQSVVNDKWNNGMSLTIPLVPASSGTLIDGYITLYVKDMYNDVDVHNLILRNIEIEIINTNTGDKIGNEGTSHFVQSQSKIINNKELIQNITTGTGTYGCSRGALKTDAQTSLGTNITGLIRTTSTTLYTGGTKYNTSKLVLQSLQAQYSQPRIKLSGDLDVTSYLYDIDSYLITDNTYLSNKAFYIYSGRYNDSDEYMSVDMIELAAERESLDPPPSPSPTPSRTPTATPSRTPSPPPPPSPSATPGLSPTPTPSVSTTPTAFGYEIEVYTCEYPYCGAYIDTYNIENSVPLTLEKWYIYESGIAYVSGYAALGGVSTSISGSPYNSCNEACGSSI